jgi:hypothetical protein
LTDRPPSDGYGDLSITAIGHPEKPDAVAIDNCRREHKPGHTRPTQEH